MAADLTRFDFHAFRFLRSESVRSMSADEVGQYILLMCEAWLTGKDASLPNNPSYLASLARVSEISPRVLKQFHLVETQWGERLQNETLFEEWLLVNQRQEAAVENGRKGGMSTSTYKIDAARENGRMGGRPKQNPSENQSETQTQTNPNQSKPNQAKPSDGGNFKNLAVRYRRAFHVNLSHGTIQKDEYSKACIQFTEDVVLAKFEEWAPENLWIKERRHTNGLRQFYEALSAMIEGDAAIKQDEEEKQQVVVRQVEIETASADAGHAEFLEEEKLRAEKRREAEEVSQRVAANPDALFGG